ncbi:MAG: 3-oxoacyl-[acyl-carrier protein] reductase [Pseudohongiellaceae bacterium]|jgi:NAD(P)-dependent dehydrogenase (short-subunit alcohol dehydrogenase family)
MDFTNQKVLVTGGSRGIGRAVSQAFAERGAQLAIIYNSNVAAAEAVLSELPGEGHIALQCDIADSTQVAIAVENVAEQLGGIDVLVNNAGIGIYHPIESTSYEDWQKAWQDTIATNLIGPANLCYCVAQKMIAGQGGRIVNISSRGAFRGEPIKPAYGASKAAINSLTQSLAIDLAKHRIFVGAVAPGFVNTDLTAARLASSEGDEIREQSPFNRVAQPEEVAYAVLFLASKGAEFSTGTIIDVNGASHMRS